jgi:hypothetical protein
MNQVFTEPMFYVFMVYSASFLLMSFVVFHGIRRASSIAFVNTFYMLVGFGLVHGITELIDWLRFILKATGAGESLVLFILSESSLLTSFILLFQFGVTLLTYKSNNKNIYRSLTALIYIALAAYILVIEPTYMSLAGSRPIVRHTLGFPGSLLSGLAFFRLAYSMKVMGHPRLIKALVITGIGFVCYAVFGGLIVEPVAGVPVQLFRAACALTIAIYSFSILDIFKVSE